MKTTGVVRRIDDLGRIVIPKEIRKSMRIKDGESLEIFLDSDNIILKKYSDLGDLVDFYKNYADSINLYVNENIIIVDRNNIVAIAGSLKKKYLNMGISDTVLRMIERRDTFVERKKKEIEISPGFKEFGYYAVATIINNGDSIGSVIILSLDTPMLEQEERLAMILAKMLSNYFS